MRPRLLLALAAAGGLAALYVWSSRARGPATSEARLAAFDHRRVTALTVAAGGESCRAVRDGAGWRLDAPVDDAASASAVEEVLVAAGRATILRAMPEAAPSPAFGLVPPEVHVELEGVATPAIDVGARIPTGEGVYARVAGHAGVVVLKLPECAALSTVRCALLRDASLLGAQASEIAAVDLAPDGPSLRKEGGAWWIEKPRRLAASPARVDALVTALARASIVAWDDAADAADPRFGLTGGRRVAVTAAGAARALTFGARAGEGRVYASREGRRGVVTVAIPALAGTSLDALRETKLTNVNRYHVVSLDYRNGAERFTATRVKGTWTPLSDDAVLALLVGLLEAPTASCEAATLPGGTRATIDYATDDGAKGHIEVVSGLASWSEAPGSVFRLAAPLPPVR
ncbi:MAG TPA: DUF4340 domain-containing protein [Candidatus Polarisedimenticolaceae bacterium]|nr:DUF4340 domain-containing protein [Candidatus Polarisedimenticolaceae bacterium]